MIATLACLFNFVFASASFSLYLSLAPITSIYSLIIWFVYLYSLKDTSDRFRIFYSFHEEFQEHLSLKILEFSLNFLLALSNFVINFSSKTCFHLYCLWNRHLFQEHLWKIEPLWSSKQPTQHHDRNYQEDLNLVFRCIPPRHFHKCILSLIFVHHSLLIFFVQGLCFKIV